MSTIAERLRPPRSSGIPVIDNGDDAFLTMMPPPGVDIGADEFVRAAARAGRLLDPPVHDALCDFADQGDGSGALLVRGMPIGRVGATPSSPRATPDKDHVSELTLLTVARRLGQPVGYAPEHGGQIVQNLLPTADDVGCQTSTSSGVELEFHTETAFHPHRPRYLLLLCLRGEPTAQTLLTSIRHVIDRLSPAVRQVLREPRFRTSVDESFLRSEPHPTNAGATGGRGGTGAPLWPRMSEPVPVVSGPESAPTFTFDADLMVGLDPQAELALAQLDELVRRDHVGLALEPGDLLVVDNAVAVHGRSSFPARFDGTDRWLQRTFVVPDLAPSASERQGRVITTRFG